MSGGSECSCYPSGCKASRVTQTETYSTLADDYTLMDLLLWQLQGGIFGAAMPQQVYDRNNLH